MIRRVEKNKQTGTKANDLVYTDEELEGVVEDESANREAILVEEVTKSRPKKPPKKNQSGKRNKGSGGKGLKSKKQK